MAKENLPMKNSPTPITGRVLLATAGLLFAGGHANAQSPPPAESTPAVAQPASPDDAEFKRKFLRNLHDLIINGLSEDEISKKLPLKLKEKEFNPKFNSNRLAFGGLGYPDGQILHEYLDKKEKKFNLFISKKYLCIKGDDIVGEFGTSFGKLLVMRDSFGPPPKSPATDVPDKETSRRNFSKFGDGPSYKISNGDRVNGFSFGFSFDESDCAQDITINQTN
jgi:hypothetical protein